MLQSTAFFLLAGMGLSFIFAVAFSILGLPSSMILLASMCSWPAAAWATLLLWPPQDYIED